MNSLPENRKINLDCFIHCFVIHTKIVVHDLIPHPGSCLPGDIGEFLSQLRGYVLRRFADNSEHPLDAGALKRAILKIGGRRNRMGKIFNMIDRVKYVMEVCQVFRFHPKITISSR